MTKESMKRLLAFAKYDRSKIPPARKDEPALTANMRKLLPTLDISEDDGSLAPNNSLAANMRKMLSQDGAQ